MSMLGNGRGMRRRGQLLWALTPEKHASKYVGGKPRPARLPSAAVKRHNRKLRAHLAKRLARPISKLRIAPSRSSVAVCSHEAVVAGMPVPAL